MCHKEGHFAKDCKDSRDDRYGKSMLKQIDGNGEDGMSVSTDEMIVIGIIVGRAPIRVLNQAMRKIRGDMTEMTINVEIIADLPTGRETTTLEDIDSHILTQSSY